ncbi:hypothetical protein AAAK29_23595 [Mesorhizobium sp. CCNWLW179-1]
MIAFNEAAASMREEDKLDRMATAMDLATGSSPSRWPDHSGI